MLELFAIHWITIARLRKLLQSNTELGQIRGCRSAHICSTTADTRTRVPCQT